MSVKCRKWVLKSHFCGMPKREDLDIVEEELPPLKDGGQLACTSSRYISRVNFVLVSTTNNKIQLAWLQGHSLQDKLS